MAKKSASGGNERGGKSEAIRVYMRANPEAKPKAVTAALAEQGIEVTPNLVSIVKAKMGIRRAKRRYRRAMANNETVSSGEANRATSLDNVLTLYKAARGQEIPSARVRAAFLSLVEAFG